MSAPNTSKPQETELEREMRLFEEGEVAINKAILAQAQAVLALQGKDKIAGLSEATARAASINLSAQDFARAWKKIGSVKENKDWNEMEREVRNNIPHFYSLFSLSVCRIATIALQRAGSASAALLANVVSARRTMGSVPGSRTSIDGASRTSSDGTTRQSTRH